MQQPTSADRALVERAYEFAKTAHEGHTRYSGEPYLAHVAAVAFQLAEMGMGPRTIVAGLLHDAVEDTHITPQDIAEGFGEEVLFLVEGVTKLSSVRYYGSDRHNESLRKLFVATSQDIRVLLIKLCDRLHNMQTLAHVPQEKQTRIARETLEIYAPVAHRLGMGRIRKELEDLAFPYVYPAEYERVTSLVAQKFPHATRILERERKALQKRLAEAGMRNFSTTCRVKGLYSLYAKLTRKDWEIDRVYDVLAIRVILPNIEACYRTLGVIHEIWRPLPKRMKDYIAFPKPNGYRSLHTTVATHSGIILEIQIRTARMHREAEHGIASHLTYKDTQGVTPAPDQGNWFSRLVPLLFRPRVAGQNNVNDDLITKDAPHAEKIPKWISEIGEMYSREQASSQEFVNDMRQDFFKNRIFVFTPQGDVVDLPIAATPLDFAYAIHSEIGDHTAGAKVNNKLVGLDTELQNGDIVEITTKKSAAPSQKWLAMAKTSLAKRHIRAKLNE